MAAPSLTSGTSSLVVSWPPATDNGSAITGYRLRYKRVGTWSSETSSWLSGEYHNHHHHQHPRQLVEQRFFLHRADTGAERQRLD